MKWAIPFLLVLVMAFEKHVVVDGNHYTLLVSPITCQSIQPQDCQPMPPAKKANVSLLQDKRWIWSAQFDCRSEGCQDEDWKAWVRECLRRRN